MQDTCTITRGGSGEPVFNAATKLHTDPATTALYTGKCRVRPPTTQANSVEAGDAQVGLQRYTVSVPMSVTGVRRDDVVTVTASQDADLVTRRLRVVQVAAGTQVTARRLTCEEVT